MNFIEDCYLCKLIKEDKILQNGKYCHKVQIGSSIFVIGSTHIDHPENTGYIEACEILFGDSNSPKNGIIQEVFDWTGHWSMKIQDLVDGFGKSTVGS